jgi:chromosome segregation ATPase
VLYLAEVQKQKGGLLGGGSKTELKLLACQKTDQSWTTVSEEVMTAEDASKLNDGALVLVDVNPNRQIQRIQEAGRPLVNILQNFSRQLEKFKVKEEEIDQWKQSLTFQAQELNHREMDMEVRLEQLQKMEEDFQRLETEKEEVKTSRAEVLRQRQELEGAWEHLRGERNRLEELQALSQQGTVLDKEQTQGLTNLLECLSSSDAPTDKVQEYLNLAFEMANRQQDLLNPHWQQLEQQRTAVDQQFLEIDQLAQILVERQDQLQQSQNSLEQEAAELKVNIANLNSKQKYASMLKEHLRSLENLYQQLQSLTPTPGSVVFSQQINVEALEKMPPEELERIIQDLDAKLNIDSSFVNDQEQELKYKQEIIEQLQQKINQNPNSGRSELEAELAEEKDLYQMLNETLVGQRRNLFQHQQLLKQHKIILFRRQGKTIDNELNDPQVLFSPILSQIETQRKQHSEELQNLEFEISQISASIDQAQRSFEDQMQQQEIKRQELQTIQENLLSLRTLTAESLGRVKLYQEALQPIQDALDGLKQKLQGIAEALTQIQETGAYQLQSVTQMREALLSRLQQ